MKSLTLLNTLCILGLAVFGFQCDSPVAPTLAASSTGDGDLLYFNSFEGDADTSGWEGYGYALSNEAPPEGGRRSMFVSGGCLWPHGLLHLKPLKQDSRLIIRCWGKNLGVGGGVHLQASGGSGIGIYVAVQDTVWTVRQSADTLFCQAGSGLDLSVGAGGIVWSAMLIDMIEIRRVQ